MSERETELSKELDDEIRRSGDLAAALRFVVRELDKPLDPLERVQLRAYAAGELKRLMGEAYARD